MENYLIEGPVKGDTVAKYINEQAQFKSRGGHAIFLGQVRDDKADKNTVASITYSAYAEMANIAFEEIKIKIMNKFPDVQQVTMLHSTGLVKAGENSLFVMISGGHRKEPRQACSETVDLIKEHVPIWKNEAFENSETRWRENDPL